MREKLLSALIILFSLFGFSYSQYSELNLQHYKDFLQNNENLTYTRFLQMYSAGEFQDGTSDTWDLCEYSDSISAKYQLTPDEISLIRKNGFMVSQRLGAASFGEHLANIYVRDLPVFISTDALIHAFHTAYDDILKGVELDFLISALQDILEKMHGKIPDLEANYSGNTEIYQNLKDADLYLTIALSLLKDGQQPYFSENNNELDNLLSYIDSYQWQDIQLFSEGKKNIDFSQFKPRGHYDDENRPQLAKYFRAMIWLGRIELYLIAPEGSEPVERDDCQRQAIDAALISELVDLSGTLEQYNQFEKVIKSFVGEQDNVTLINLRSVLEETNIMSADELTDTLKFIEFQDSLAQKSFADQKILSQILIEDPMNPDDVKPASAFLLFGQRFVIDSYVTGSVVFDKIKGTDLKRMLPSTLDILFACGNDAVGQLLKPEIEKYGYSANLAGLRYLIDSYGKDFWNNSIYNLWLNSIRAQNPPVDRTALPVFMQSAAWWQQKINSQLSTWTELRHDNLLYAKQSYTPGVGCSYPYSYVEPVPEFYEKLKELLTGSKEKLVGIMDEGSYLSSIISYFDFFANVADTLISISEKELSGTVLDNNEVKFLKNMLYKNTGGACGAPLYLGWYLRLYTNTFGDKAISEDYLVADYHTAPTDEVGTPVGWVKHAGTGPVELAVITAVMPDNKKVAFIGPVASYYEYTSTNFLRLTDDEWKDEYLMNASRPDWVNIYLADENGKSRGKGISLITDIKNGNGQMLIPENYITAVNYPNPFNPETIIRFTVPSGKANSPSTLKIYNIQGQEIKTLINRELPSGTYLTKWDGTNNNSLPAASGIYIYELKVGNLKFAGKMNLIK